LHYVEREDPGDGHPEPHQGRPSFPARDFGMPAARAFAAGARARDTRRSKNPSSQTIRNSTRNSPAPLDEPLLTLVSCDNACVPVQSPGPQGAADLRYANMQHALGAGRRVLAPQRMDQAFAGNHIARTEQQEGEKLAMSWPAHLEQRSLVEDFQRPEDPIFHLTPPTPPKPRQRRRGSRDRQALAASESVA
jgi:hypothetical protein